MFILLTGIAKAQNLVPNPSFEDYDTCPAGISQPGNSQVEHCLGWYSPSLATSDYLHSCSPIIGGGNVPNVAFGYQSAHDGDGMLGLMLVLDSGEIPYFEYVQTKINSPLTAGHVYKFSFHANPANGSDYTVRKIGAWFTTNAVSSNDGQSLFSTSPQIQNNYGFITDTAEWTLIEGEFIANGGEEYLTIGYYSDEANPDTMRNNPIADPNNIFVYYYIDGMGLELTGSEPSFPNVITPNGDGINDFFLIKFPHESAVIYNRWGQKLFEGRDQVSWDGRTPIGDAVPDGTYYYVVTIGKNVYKGFVQVIR